MVVIVVIVVVIVAVAVKEEVAKVAAAVAAAAMAAAALVRPSTYFIKLTFHDFPHAPGPPLPQGLYGVLNGLGRTDKVRIVVGNTGAGMFGRLC